MSTGESISSGDSRPTQESSTQESVEAGQQEAANPANDSSSDPNVAVESSAVAKQVPAQNSSETSAEASTADVPAKKPAGLGAGPLAARGLGMAKPTSPAAAASTDSYSSSAAKTDGGKESDRGLGGGKSKRKKAPRPRLAGEKDSPATSPDRKAAASSPKPGKVPVPSSRQPLPDDIQAELEAQLAESDVEAILGGSAGMPDRKEPLAEGARLQGTVLKIHQDSVFISLGGPDEGVVAFEQFETEPVVGTQVEVMVRGFNGDDGLYVLTLPGQAVDVADWGDLDEGSVVEVVVTGHNAGGLECKAGAIKGFIPISQVTEYRVEDLSEFVDQKFVCLVTEANMRRGNLVLSRRAILEREREEKRKEQLEKLEVGDELEGIVRTVKDFGAFVDLGGLDGLIHISKLSWDRIKHPSEVLEPGQQVKVRLDKVDKQSGKISLSYRDLLENPWDTAETSYAVGTIHRGTVTRIANFGCFVRLTAGIEGLVHISELAHHRVSKIDAFVSEGDEVEVKVLTFDRDSQKIALSMKAAQTKSVETKETASNEVEEPPREVAVKASHSGPLKGGNDRDTGGERFGLRW